MSVIATSLLSLIQYAPQAITEIIDLYNAIKSDLTAGDQAQIDAALAAAQTSDAQATAAADIALDQAARR